MHGELIIVQDSVWSERLEEQIIGRVHRQANARQAIVYYPRIEGTSDVVLRQSSRGKEQLLAKFLKFDRIEDDEADRDQENECLFGNDGKDSETGAKKGKKGKGKNKAVTVAGGEGDGEAAKLAQNALPPASKLTRLASERLENEEHDQHAKRKR